MSGLARIVSRYVRRGTAAPTREAFARLARATPPHDSRSMSRIWVRYACLGAGIVGIGYYAVQNFGSGTRDDNFRLVWLFGLAFFSGYLGHRYIRSGTVTYAKQVLVDYLAPVEIAERSSGGRTFLARAETAKADAISSSLLRASSSNCKTFTPSLSNFRVAHCETADSKEDADKLDEVLRELQLKVTGVKADIKVAIDKKAEEMWQLIKEKYVTKPLEEAFDFVKEILDNLKDFVKYDELEFKAPLFILLGLIARANDQLDKEWLASLPKISELKDDEFRLHKRIGQFALNVYDASLEKDRSKVAKKMGIDSEEDIVFARFAATDEDDDDHFPRFIVFLDHETRSVVWAIRGTFSFTDVVIDVVCDDDEFLDGFSHRGILRGTRRVLADAGRTIRAALETFPGYRLTITGHSLGAGTAELVTMQILSDKTKYIPSETEVRCVALAPPPIFRSKSPVPKHVTDSIDIYINRQDCVPRLSLASIARLLAALREVDDLALTPYQHFQLLSGISNDDESKDNLKKVRDIIVKIQQDRFSFLEHPGRIHYFYQLRGGLCKEEAKNVYVTREESRTFSGQLVLLERMILDHMQAYYEDAFKKANIRGK